VKAKSDDRLRLRIFVAVFPPPATQATAAGVIERLRQPEDGVSWVRADNLHYTVRFLGDLGEDGAERAAAAVSRAATAIPRFEATLGAPGAFPNPRRARVLWLGLEEGAEALIALAAAVENGLRRAGFGRAERAFAPHLTIGRVRQPLRDWTEALAAASAAAGHARFAVSQVDVVHSTLSPKGSIYRLRAAAQLAEGS
jgi:RNA 2',3'-cyclic 3'-phosphodiesterase